MLVKVERIRNSTNLLVISELDEFLGEIIFEDFINSMIGTGEEIFDIDGYDFYNVDKNLLFQSFLPEKK